MMKLPSNEELKQEARDVIKLITEHEEIILEGM